MGKETSSRGPPAERRILIVDDHPILRRGLRALIHSESDLTVCAEAATERAALEAITAFKPDLVIVDLSLEHEDGLNLVRLIQSGHEAPPIVVLTMHDAPSYAQRAFQAGASGYVNKGEMSDTLLPVIRRLLADDKPVGRKIRGTLRTS